MARAGTSNDLRTSCHDDHHTYIRASLVATAK
ncbi:hypothetical protein NK6_9720 [Bradyrhizobium diazoefficiens]|uniref:Uncharacterized protein n=1 Tax=Bradyrhizobium diazoefficiens TaxID=1355477 RepID=A0A0E4FYM9_9BRAD|nr:hypothetical protein NK6_9720 [Bradyrhizobium diazoefficiens]